MQHSAAMRCAEIFARLQPPNVSYLSLLELFRCCDGAKHFASELIQGVGAICVKGIERMCDIAAVYGSAIYDECVAATNRREVAWAQSWVGDLAA